MTSSGFEQKLEYLWNKRGYSKKKMPFFFSSKGLSHWQYNLMSHFNRKKALTCTRDVCGSDIKKIVPLEINTMVVANQN